MQNNRVISFQLYTDKEEKSNWVKGLEICYVLTGKGTLKIMQDRHWKIVENDIFVINMYEMHQILLEPESLILRLVIPEEFVLNVYPEMEHLKIECLSFLFEKEAQAQFDKLRENVANAFLIYSKSESQLQIRGIVSCLLSELITSFGKQKEDTIGKKGREQLGMLMEYVRQNYQEDISLADFSEKIHYSSSHLSHLMKSELGMSFKEYVKAIRLQQALKLLRSGESITLTSDKTGFVNSNAFIKAFRDTYGITPGKYRTEQQNAVQDTDAELFQNMGYAESHVFDRLLGFCTEDGRKISEKKEVPEMELCRQKVNMRCSGNSLSESWRFCVNGGYAKRLLYEPVRAVIRKAQEEIGFTYIRLKDIFDDELGICTRDRNNRLIFNFVLLDHILDFICSCHARPWIELSYTPSALTKKKRKEQDLWLIEMPDEPEEWYTLSNALLLHIKERYGETEAGKWIITPFADIFLVNMHMSRQEGYYELYGKTYELIRKILPGTKIAARGTFEKDGTGLGDYMVQEKLLPDFWTLVSYHSVLPSEEESELNLIESMEAYSMITSKDTEYLKNLIQSQKRELQAHGIFGVPLLLAEWNSTVWQRDLCSDTAYKACYLLKNILENHSDIAGFSYWHISDWNDDYLPSPHRFHGGFGLFTRDNIPKAAYSAFLLLGKARGKIRAQGNGYMVLGTNERVLIYLYHYCPYDMLYRYRHVRNIDQGSRYQVFEAKNDICYHIELNGMQSGEYRKTVYQISPEEGSACDIWMQMGAPERLDETEYDCLIAAGRQKSSSRIQIEAEYIVRSILKPHTIQLIELKKTK